VRSNSGRPNSMSDGRGHLRARSAVATNSAVLSTNTSVKQHDPTFGTLHGLEPGSPQCLPAEHVLLEAAIRASDVSASSTSTTPSGSGPRPSLVTPCGRDQPVIWLWI
jgi:hypothetical protein